MPLVDMVRCPLCGNRGVSLIVEAPDGDVYHCRHCEDTFVLPPMPDAPPLTPIAPETPQRTLGWVLVGVAGLLLTMVVAAVAVVAMGARLR